MWRRKLLRADVASTEPISDSNKRSGCCCEPIAWRGSRCSSQQTEHLVSAPRGPSRWAGGSGRAPETRGCISLLTWPVCLWNRHVHDSPSILRFGGRRGEPADPRLRRGAGGQAVRVLVCPCRQLFGRCVRDEALGDGELGVPQLLLHLGVLVGPGQLFVRGRGTFCGDHAASSAICAWGRENTGEPSLHVPAHRRAHPRAVSPRSQHTPQEAWVCLRTAFVTRRPLHKPQRSGLRGLCFNDPLQSDAPSLDVSINH